MLHLDPPAGSLGSAASSSIHSIANVRSFRWSAVRSEAYFDFDASSKLESLDIPVHALVSWNTAILRDTPLLTLGPSKANGGADDRKLWYLKETPSPGDRVWLNFGKPGANFRVAFPKVAKMSHSHTFYNSKGIAELYLNKCNRILANTFVGMQNLIKLIIGGETVSVTGTWLPPNTTNIDLVISANERSNSGAVVGPSGTWQGATWKSVTAMTRTELDSMTFE